MLGKHKIGELRINKEAKAEAGEASLKPAVVKPAKMVVSRSIGAGEDRLI